MPDLFLAVNCHGPEGQLVEAGYPVPPEWPEELVQGLVDSGGAGDQAYVEGVIGRPVELEPAGERAAEFAFENPTTVTTVQPPDPDDEEG